MEGFHPASSAPRLLVALVLGAALALPGCSRLPSYGRPQISVIRADQYTATDVVRYRRLSREDFRAQAPPRAVAAHAAAMGAYTCASVVPEDDPLVVFEEGPVAGTFVARFKNARFFAEMDRGCSWWNADQPGLPIDYTLEHEQIHFALTEIHARRLTARVAGEQAVVGSPEEASRVLQARYEKLVRQAGEQLLRDHTSFDEETSLRHAPVRQARWRLEVERELTGAW